MPLLNNHILLEGFEIVILWVYDTIPFGFSLFWHIWDISFQLLKLLLWLRTTNEGSVPEMRIWSILLIKSDLKWCIHLSRSLFLYSLQYLLCPRILRTTLVNMII